MEKLKEHIKKHKTVYIAAGTGVVVAGITVVVMRDRYANLQSGLDERLVSRDVNTRIVRSLNIFSPGQTNKMVNVVERDGRGHPGYMIRCLETNEIWTSQKKTAQTQGISPSVLSDHLRGNFENINGLHYERVHIVA